jgi:hypothetical protein
METPDVKYLTKGNETFLHQRALCDPIIMFKANALTVPKTGSSSINLGDAIMFAPLAALALALGTVGATTTLTQGNTEATEAAQSQTVQTAPAPGSVAGPFLDGSDS